MRHETSLAASHTTSAECRLMHSISLPLPGQTGSGRPRRYVLSLPVRSTVHLFVCYQTCEHDVLKTNGLMHVDAISTSDSRGKGMKWSTLGVRRSKVKVNEAEGRFGICAMLDPFASRLFPVGLIMK